MPDCAIASIYLYGWTEKSVPYENLFLHPSAAPFPATVPCENQPILLCKEPLMANAGVLSSPIHVLVVDDCEPWRRHICSILRTQWELRVIAEVGDGLEAVQKARELQPDLILLDIGLPKLNGINAADQISRIVPAATILFVSQISDPDVVEEALSTGAKGYVWKQEAGVELLPAVEAVLGGAHFLSTGVAKSHATSSLN